MRRGKFESRLEQNGYKKIGYGAFSNVYAKKDKDFVVKVGSDDDRWQDYIEWAIIKGYAGTFAPKVYSFKHYGEFYVAVMERLVDTEYGMTKECNSAARYIKLLVNTLRVGLYENHEYNHLPEAIDLIEFGRDVGYSGMCTDMHEGNVMIRKDGQLVLIDPLSGNRNRDPLHIKRGQIRKSKTTIVINLGGE